MIELRTALMVLAAFGGGVAIAGFFLSGPVERPKISPVQQVPSQTSSIPSQPPADRAPVRVIPIDGSNGGSQAPTDTTAGAVRERPADPGPPQARQQRPAESVTTGMAPLTERETTGSTIPIAPAPSGARGCNIDACSQRYSSFRSSDCTYQPFGGPRRTCGLSGERVARDRDDTDVLARSREDEDSPAPDCNIAACSHAYRSFDPSTCTYRSYGGSRRVCDK
jgi:hypothetical protein